MDVDPDRLPRTVSPRRYELRIEPNLDDATFTGTVHVDLDVHDDVDQLVLNAADLTIHAATVDDEPATATLDTALERVTITPRHRLTAGSARLELQFSGTINDKLHGFYRSVIRDAAGADAVIGTTQMQSTDCRRALPCWDEPDFKAVFSITLVVQPGHVAVSNAPEVSRVRLADGRDEVRFADTMPMSSYLVAFVVGPLAVTPSVDVDGTAIRIVHPPGKEHLTAFGLDAAVAGLRYFERYYDIPYPGHKIDLIALPDFASGAMENLGCITFRENLLIIDPATSTQPEQQVVVDVILHELAHMWFGDLVTMRWWNGIWLNEAFATFMEVEATDAYRPDWDRWTAFALERGTAFEVDSLATTRPVEYEVRSPADAEGMFDVLTYQKGGALLRMLQQYLGPEAFRDGIRHYLRTHAYGNTETSDLWDALEDVTGEPVRRLMDSWIWQPGFPLVTATVSGATLTLRQERFGYSPAAMEDPATWIIPLHLRAIAATGETARTVLLETDRLDVTLDDPDAVVVVNAGGHAFVRVAYSRELLTRLSGHALSRLSTIERYNLVADAWAGVVARRLGAADFLQMVRGFGDETALPVWQAIVAGLRGCDRLLDDDSRPRFAATVRALVAPALQRLGWEARPEEDQLTGQLRSLLVQTVAVLGEDELAIARCRELFDHPETTEPELLAAATVVVATAGDAATYERYLEAFRHATVPQHQLRFLNALAEFDDEELVLRTCALAFTDEVRTQNAPFLLLRAIANRRHGVAAWRFVRERWAEANARFPSNTIVRMVDSVKLLNTEEVGADVQAFFAEHDIPQGRATLAQILERQRVNIALRLDQHDALTAALG